MAVPNIQKALTYAGFWVRVGAAIIDGVILFVLQFVITLMFSPVLRRDNPTEARTLAAVLSLLQLAFGVVYEAG